MNQVGRHRQFRNAAEKQKAYRERQKAILALLNALPEEPERSGLERAYAEVKRIEARNHKHTFMSFWSAEFLAMGYDTWKKLSFEYHEEWWTAQQKWYEAWKAAGFPGGYKP